MKTKRLTILTALMAMFVMSSMSPLRAAEMLLARSPDHAAAASPEEADLQKRFKARYPQIQQLKKDGVIGETDAGYVDLVKSKDAKVAKLLDEENADRKTLYKLIADREGITIEIVAQRAAKRNFDKAKPGEWLKEGGKWHQKEGGAPAR